MAHQGTEHDEKKEMNMTNPIAIAALLGTLGASPYAAADSLTPPPDMPPSYRTECGNCHVVYPPNLLTAGGAFSGTGWRSIMEVGALRAHYGESAELEEPVRRQIEQYLVEHAASSERRFGSRTDPARLTTTLWFHRNHGGVKPYFANARFGSRPANCQACHPRADHWRYDREEVVLPKLPHRD
jgi:hypothetical protein